MKLAKRGILLFIFIFLIIENAHASSHSNDSIYPFLNYKHFGEEEGLTCKTVYSCIQDNDGFMWFGTDNGVYRYDGRKFKHFTKEDGVTDNEVLDLFKDHLNRIWFLTLNGHLSYWQKGKIYNSHNSNLLKIASTGEATFSCFEDGQKRLWFGTQSLGFLVISNDSAQKVNTNEDGKSLSSEYIYQDKSGQIWTFSWNKMYKLLQKKSTDTILLGDTIKFHSACHATENSEMFFCSSKGLFRIFDKQISLYINSNSLPDSKEILSIKSKGDYLWLCTLNGCYEYKKGRFTYKYLENYVVTSVLKDREDNLWFNTLSESTFMLTSNLNGVKNFNHSAGLSGERVTSIANSQNNFLWLGYDNGIVDNVVGNKKKSFNLLKGNKRSFLRITGLIVDHNLTWCGTDLGLYSISKNKINLIRYGNEKTPAQYYTIKNLFKDNSSNIWSASTFSFLKLAHDKDGYYLQQKTDSLMRCFSIVEIHKEHYIISCTNNLLEYIPNKLLIPYNINFDFSKTRIIDLKLDHDSLLILASSDHGLYIFSNKNLLQHLSLESGLSSDNCNKIFIYKNQIYIATNHGLSVLEKKGKYYYLLKNLTTKDGLLSNSVNDIMVNDTSVFIATEKGLTILPKDILPKDIFIATVYPTEIITDTTITVSYDHYSFNADIPRLVIRFAYPVFNPSSMVNLKYRLTQNKKNNLHWITSETNEVEFSSLSPGKYIFQIKPDIANLDEAMITNVYLDIVPLWWQTVFFKLFISLFALAFAIAVSRKITKRRYDKKILLLKQRTALEVERNRIARDMHDDLGADLTYIAILGELVMQNTRLENEAVNNINKITEASKKVIYKMGEIIWALNSTNDSLPNLISYLHKYSKEFLESKGIECSVVIPEFIPDKKLSAAFRRNIFLIFKEATNNIVKHSGTKKTALIFTVEHEELIICLKDFGRRPPKNDPDNKGNGLKNMKKRALENNGELEITFLDGQGTLVEYRSKI